MSFCFFFDSIFLFRVLAVLSYQVRRHLICLPLNGSRLFCFSLSCSMCPHSLYLSSDEGSGRTAGVLPMSLGRKNGLCEDNNCETADFVKTSWCRKLRALLRPIRTDFVRYFDRYERGLCMFCFVRYICRSCIRTRFVFWPTRRFALKSHTCDQGAWWALPAADHIPRSLWRNGY